MLKKLRNKKGFTLAELLIVVAIIGVLVAISIPIFTSQLEKAREATDLANIRSAYAECSSSVLTNEASSGKVTLNTDGSAQEDVDINQKTKGWSGDNANAKIGSYAVTDLFKDSVPAKVTVKVTADGVVTITPNN
ncbi:MAG: type II secretion system protein [Erysipelotrichaceae bacterium]|jgi:prepilin-type N-terminal cleavage/methylation domain-containing protein